MIISNYNIPFHKPHLCEEEIREVSDTIQSGWITMGPKTVEFEKAFKNYIGTGFAASLNSATAALHLSLSGLGISEGDEVIIPTNTFIATAEVVVYLGAKPVLCDIEPETHNINVKLIQDLITPKTKAIIPVHFAGQPCDMDEILCLADEYNIKVIEDAAHALPAYYKNKKIGTLSHSTCFSFYATKTLTTGEGGMVTTNIKSLSEKIALQRLHGINGDAWKRNEKEKEWYYEVIDLGYKYNTTDIQSALGLVQLRKLEKTTFQRKLIYEKYLEKFDGKIDCIKIKSDRKSSYHLFIIKIKNRDELYKSMKKNGISTSVHFIPIHKQPYYKSRFKYDDGNYPESNKVFHQSLSLPIYPYLKEHEVDYIIENVLKYSESV